MNILLAPIAIPLIAAACVLCIPRGVRFVKEALALAATGITLWLSAALFSQTGSVSFPWLGQSLEFSLKLYSFSAFILLAVSAFGFLTALYSSAYTAGKGYAKQFYAYLLITVAFVNGAVLADNLLVMLFFWEGLLVTIFAMIAIGGAKSSFTTAIKALVIVGVTDLCMMLGIGLAGRLAGTFTISQISLPLTAAGSAAFVLLMVGAVSKAGSMPFHTWIPDAALDAPLPFMALLPGALEKLLGIYFLTRICLDLFQLTPESPLSILLMALGGITILFAVMMALIQKNYKKLLAYHAISQVGYMILGVGTMVPVGIVGGLFHMVNNALYKSGLFFSGGAVEKQAGTADLNGLGGLGRAMPLTFACFIVFAASISGVWPFNGFFSKELVYDAALERGMVFYLFAVVGSFFTAASFLKLGHAAFVGKPCPGRDKVRECSWLMLAPMLIIAALCVFFGVNNALPIDRLIVPSVAGKLHGSHHAFSGFPANIPLVVVTVLVLIAAIMNHLYGSRKTGAGLKAVDHIHYAPGLHWVYDRAERGWFDPYKIGMKLTAAVSYVFWLIDRVVDWIYETAVVKGILFCAGSFRKSQPGNYPGYLVWSLVGMALVVLFLMRFVTGG